jgi:hypothetical protein
MGEWREIAGFEGRYEVSDEGRVRNMRTGKVFAVNLSSKGYPVVALCRKPEKPKSCRVHRLVALAFIQNPDALPEVNHKDSDKANNHVSNLEWVTSQQNMQHSIAAGRQTGITNPNKAYRFSPEDVALIRSRYDAGDRVRDIARDLGVKHGSISKIACGRARKYEPGGKKRERAPRKRPIPKTRRPLKLNAERVVALREMRATGATISECATAFDLTERSVRRVVGGFTWKHVPMPAKPAPSAVVHDGGEQS